MLNTTVRYCRGHTTMFNTWSCGFVSVSRSGKTVVLESLRDLRRLKLLWTTKR